MALLTRRDALAAIGAASIGVAGCLSLSTADGRLEDVDGEWPMAGSDPGHTGAVAAGPSDPRQVWTADLQDARSASTPSLAEGRLYVPADAVSDRARYRYRLHSLAAATGTERWRVPLRAEPNPSPAVRGDRIVVTARRSLERGRIVAFRRRYGEEAWLRDVDARLTAPPTVAGSTVYVPEWSGTVHALSIGDGSVEWSRSVSDRTFATPAAVEGDAVFLAAGSGETGVVCLEADGGAERWSRSTEVVTAGPVVDDGLVVVRAESLIVAFDEIGTRKWSYNVPGSDGRSLAVDDRHVYAPAGDTVYAIDRDGELAWTYESERGGVGSPTVAGDAVLVREDGRIAARAQADGTAVWRTAQSGHGRPIVTPGGVFVTGDGGHVVGLGTG